jgi:hypothetical protein
LLVLAWSLVPFTLTNGVNHRFEVGTDRRAVRSYRRAQLSGQHFAVQQKRAYW